MKLLTVLLAGVSAFGLLSATTHVAAQAGDTKMSYRMAKAEFGKRKRSHARYRYGSCAYDTGKFLDQLSFASPCGAEEFWRRIEQMGSLRR